MVSAMFVAPPLLLLLFCSSSPTSRATGDAQNEYTVVTISSLEPKAACSGHRVTPPYNSTWLPLHLHHGPCSPSDDAPATPSSLVDVLRQDQLRVDDIQKRLSDDVRGSEAHGVAPLGTTTDLHRTPGQQPATTQRLGSHPHHPHHHPHHHPKPKHKGKGHSWSQELAAEAASRGGGSNLPGVAQTVVLDTASDVAWVQCVPCPAPLCHPQTDTVYDPTQSATYSAFPCNSTACTALGPYGNGCVNNQCQYLLRYPDGSSTSGTYSSDLLTLTATASVSTFQFGCSHTAQGNFDGTTAGILSLGGGSESLVSQTAVTYGNVFSYCVPPTTSAKGFFVLGVPHHAATRYVLTPMLQNTQAPATFHRVLLQAITVSGQTISVPPAVFAPGSVLDSRTVITRLPPTAYRALRDAFRSRMTMYRAAPPQPGLDTCYDLRGVASVRLPTVALVFDRNASVQLDPAGVLFNGCLAFGANANDLMPSILGNVQFRTIEVLYNVKGGLVGFRRGAC